MKKTLILLILSLILPTCVLAESSGEYVKAMWVSTVYGLDFPKTSDSASQKNELLNILKTAEKCGINQIYFQVRPTADSFYKSELVPMSEYLKGVSDYDPLAFLIQEAHKCGIKVHAWFNPYRVSMSINGFNPPANSVFYTHGDWIKTSGGKYVIDPGIPEARKWIEDCVAEVLRNYEVDGIHFDDYFYYETSASPLNDDDTHAAYGEGFADKADWRRNNTYMLIKETHDLIKSIKSNVEFGVSPAGIWRNKKNDPNGSDTAGAECYDRYFADTKKWVEDEIIDYIVPQVYWSNKVKAAPYDTVVSWWSNVVKNTKVKLYVGHAIYKVNDGGSDSDFAENGMAEIERQYEFNRKDPNVCGSVFFRAEYVEKWSDGLSEILRDYTEIPSESKTLLLFYDMNERLTDCIIRNPENGKISLSKAETKGRTVRAYSLAGGKSELIYYK